jgi:hypothetical protein
MSSPMLISSRRMASRRLGGKAGEVLGERQSGDIDLGRQECFQRHRRRQLAGPYQAAANVVDLLMNRLEEVLRLEEIGNAIERLVIDEDRAQERLFRFDVVRRGTVSRRGGFQLPT